MAIPVYAISGPDLLRQGIRFSICTLVTNHEQYAEMTQSFLVHGFVNDECEFLYIDNSQSNEFDAYTGYNLFLTAARGEFVILCHQDIILLEHDREILEQRLSELSEIDPTWGACGNAGGISPTQLAIRITDRYGKDQHTVQLPARVSALDENFIVVRRDANLAVSHDLHGFHLYGADLCIIAKVLGRSTYVIDFHLEHTGQGKKDSSYDDIRRRLVAKYTDAFGPAEYVSTTTHFILPSSRRARLREWLGRLLRRIQLRFQ